MAQHERIAGLIPARRTMAAVALPICRYGQRPATAVIIYESFAALPNVVVYRFGAFTLRDNESLWLGDSLVPLSPLQLRLLAYFCSHPQQIHPKERIAAEVWGRPEVSDVSLARAVHGLRSRLVGGGKPSELIRNVYGRGYLLTQPVSIIDAPESGATPDASEPIDSGRPPVLRETEHPLPQVKLRRESNAAMPPLRAPLSAVR